MPEISEKPKKASGRAKKARKTARNIIISTVVLLILLLGAGFLYTKFSDGNANVSMNFVQSSTTATPQAVKPPTVSPNAQESISIEVLSSPAPLGSEASMAVQTNPNSKCTLKIQYKGTKVKDTVLQSKQADSYGNANWGWTVARTTPLGTWPVTVTCFYHSHSAKVIGNIKVTAK